MLLLDEIQDTFREPNYSDNASRIGETVPVFEYDYIMSGKRNLDDILAALEWIDSEEANKLLRTLYRGKCVLVLGRGVVGSGDTWEGACQNTIEVSKVSPLLAVKKYVEDFPCTL